MNRSLPLLALLLSMSVAATVCAREPSPNDLLAIGDNAILPAPPSVVADYSEQGVWSPDGRFVLAWRNALRLPLNLPDPAVDNGLWLWTAQTGKTREVWQSRMMHPQNTPIGWLSGTSVALTTVEVPPVQPNPQVPTKADRWIARLDARTGSVKLTANIPPYEEVQVAPRVPYAVVRDGDGSLRLVKSDGVIGAAISLPNGKPPAHAFWAADGMTLLIGGDYSNEKDALVGSVFGYDPRSGKVRPVDAPAARWSEREPAAAVRLVHSRGDLRDGPSAIPLKPLWLTARQGVPPARTLIAPDAEWGKLSPSGDGVLYLQDGTLMVRRLVTFPKVAINKAQETAQRQVLMSDCKQIGLALIIHAGENGDQLPGQGEPVDAIITKIAKSEIITQGFIYTFPGGKITDIQEPSKTILGYKLGAGGRANVYADGHVMWEAD